jgi:primary-amine oxidase
MVVSSQEGTMVATQVQHALDPLTADEIATATRILREAQGLPEKHRFIQVSLHEPPKEAVLAGEETDREAFIILLDHDTRTTWEAIVNISRGAVTSWEMIPNVQPPIAMEEFFECEQAAKADPRFREALAKRGVTDMDLVMLDPWSAGSYEDPEGRRLSRALTWVRKESTDHGYAHPVDNLVTLVDLHEMQVVRVDDFGVVPIPWEDGNYSQRYVTVHRPGLKPLEINQPEGPSFEVDGHEVRWQNWRFRVGFTPREGLVLHQVGWEQDGRVRPVLYRASLAEMVVPYGDPSPVHSRKNAFDVGEYNIGLLTNSLELGCDCLGHIHYFDVDLADNRGNPMVLKNAICMHEEDAGLLWKHTDFRTEEVEVRRSRKLIVSFIATVGNYEYAFYWSFFQDGQIMHEIKMTGVVSTGAVVPGTQPKYGELLNAAGLYAPIHQHFFNFRLDFDVDGTDNTVVEVHAEAEPAGADNPIGNAFYSKATPLTTELAAQQLVDPLRGRVWYITNPAVRNALGKPVGYRLVPHTNVAAFASPEASVSKRATFMHKHLWVTPYNARERFPAGDYPNQHAGGAGLPEWTAANRNIEDTDVVVWYTLGSHHPVRPEDWPVMPVQTVSFALQPVGFFTKSPALDVQPPKHAHNGHCEM